MGINLDIKNLHFSYSEEKILQDININIKPGSFLSIIGPNGSGKSTLLKNISKIVKPNQGEIWLDTLDLLALSPRKIAEKMAVVPQNFNIDFPFTVYETVLMGRTPYLKRFQSEGDKDYALAKWAMEITNTLHLKDRKITEISGGELQRVIVARALTQEPRIILLDEPTSHLDIQHQLELLELLQSLNKTRDLTVVAVLHDLNLAAQFSDTIILLHKGKIFAGGDPHKVLSPENIRAVYEMEITHSLNPLTGKLTIIPLGRSINTSQIGTGQRIHLICGGGTGIFLMERLVRLNYEVSCGVVNIGDSDWSTAKKLNLKVSEEAPFTPISEKAAKKNKELLEKADYVIVTSFPFGTGNLANLELALEAAKAGKQLFVVLDSYFTQKDFTDGKASKLLQEIISLNSACFQNPGEIIKYLTEKSEQNEAALSKPKRSKDIQD